MKCAKCGHEVDPSSPNCPYCAAGVPPKSDGDAPRACCPRCGSTSLSVNKQGFGAGKAIFIGPLAGTIGMNKLKITCLNCGYKYKPGKGRQ